MIMTKHKRDINLFVLQLGAALAVSFAGLLVSRFRRKRTQRTKPSLPPLRPQLSDCSNKSIINRECDLVEKDVFLLPEFEEEIKKLVYDECEASNSAPIAFPSEDESDRENEIKQLKNTVRALLEQERSLEDKLLEYYSLKEQPNIAMELRSRLILNQMETKVFNLKIKSLQAENEKLKAQCSEHSKAVSELDSANSQVELLMKKLNLQTQKHVEQISSLRERVAKLQEEEMKAFLPNQEADKTMEKLRDLESEIDELTDSNTKLLFENFELAETLESVQIIANSKLEDSEDIERLREDSNRLRNENEELKKEVEQLQGDGCTDLEELVYLRWINACLRYELRTYQPPEGKTVARDLSVTLSPNSEEKAKELILEYAHSKDNTDYDQWSSSQEESSMVTTDSQDDSSVDTLFATKAKKLRKKKLMHKLMNILHGKDTPEGKKRTGSSVLRSTHSMDFQLLIRGKDEEEDFKDSMGMVRRKSEAVDSSIYGEEDCLESDQKKKKELIRYAEALRKSSSSTSTKKMMHKKSISFFF